MATERALPFIRATGICAQERSTGELLERSNYTGIAFPAATWLVAATPSQAPLLLLPAAGPAHTTINREMTPASVSRTLTIAVAAAAAARLKHTGGKRTSNMPSDAFVQESVRSLCAPTTNSHSTGLRRCKREGVSSLFRFADAKLSRRRRLASLSERGAKFERAQCI